MRRSSFITAGSGAAGLALSTGSVVAAWSGVVRFGFHNDFWMNLHHRLYREAATIEFKDQGYALRGGGPELYADIQRVPLRSRTEWNQALEIYRKQYVSKDLLFDPEMTAIKTTLAKANDRNTLRGLPLPENLAEALALAAPVYREKLWPEDFHSNVAWIDAVRPLIRQHSEKCSVELARIYRTAWLQSRYRMDVVRYANYLGAYTTADPLPHTVITSEDRNYRGRASLEMLFHEASHSIVYPDDGTVGKAILEAARAARHPEPDQFWHAVIFYTAGSVTQSVLRAAGERPYVMYADVVGLFGEVWPTYRKPLEMHWQRYMDGGDSLKESLTKAVDTVVKA